MNKQTMPTPQEFWDEKFAPDNYLYGTEPNEWLSRQRHLLPDGASVLSVADGEGRNGVWLAQQGFRVTTVDASPRALQKAAALAEQRGVSLVSHCTDLRKWAWPEQAFDAVVSVFAHFHRDYRAGIHSKMLQAVKPGGLIVMQAYSPFQLIHGTGGPPSLEMLYTAYMLEQDFAGCDFLTLEEVETEISEGSGHKGASAVVNMVARRSEVSG